jgi:hypothetical protein
MKIISDQLLQIVNAAQDALLEVLEEDSMAPVLKGGWSRKQVLGHLIDSASNNHQRFVRVSLQGSLEFPGYDQDGCVRVQAIQDAPWPVLVALWVSYNRFLAHVIARLPADKLEAPCRIGAGQPVTLRFLVEDYVAHLLHHLRQIDAVPSEKVTIH